MFKLPDNNKPALIYKDKVLSFRDLNHLIQQYQEYIRQFNNHVFVLTASISEHFIALLLAGINENKTMAVLPADMSNTLKSESLNMLVDYATFDDHYRVNFVSSERSCEMPCLARYHSLTRLILFTSGSSGQIKGVQLSYENILANCDAVIESLDLKEVSSQMLYLPLSYSFGLTGQLFPALLSGIATTLIGQFLEIKPYLESRNIPEMWSGVPSHWQALTKLLTLAGEDKTKIKKIVSAGAPLSIKLRQQLKLLLPDTTIYNNYGLTEASPRVLCLSSRSPLFLTEATGYPVGDWEIKVNEKEELLIKGKQLMLGYLGESTTCTEDGWFNTQDIAEIDANQLVTIRARKQLMIKIGGEKVNLAKLELLISSKEEITEAIILPIEDELYGYRLIACLEGQCSPEILIKAAKSALYPKVYPIQFYCLNQLIRYENGKINRRALEKLIDEGGCHASEKNHTNIT